MLPRDGTKHRFPVLEEQAPAAPAAPAAVESGAEEIALGTSPPWTLRLEESRYGERMDLATLHEEATEAQLIFVGEVYARPQVVQLELDLLRASIERLRAAESQSVTDEEGTGAAAARGVAYVVMEHFSVAMQPMIDRFMRGELLFREMLEEYSLGDEGHDLKAYEPLLEFAREHAAGSSAAAEKGVEVQLIGGFLPRSIAKTAVADGIEVALCAAKAGGYVRADEDCSASEEHYSMFEALVTGRPMHDHSTTPSNIARRLFPAQVLKGCSMAHTVAGVVAAASAEGAPPFRVLVACGASHMAYSHGVPERVLAVHPQLAVGGACCRIYAREAEGGDVGILSTAGLRAVFGESCELLPADVAFVFSESVESGGVE